MPRLEGDLLEPLAGGGARRPRRRRDRAVRRRRAVTVVLAGARLSRPAATTPARRSTGIDEAEADAARSSSTAARRCATGTLVTNGGRILSVTALGATRRGGARARLRGGRPRSRSRARSPATRHRGGGRWLSRSSASCRLGVRPRADAGGARRARRARDRVGVRGALGAPHARRRRRVREGRRPGAACKVLICGAGLAAALPGVVAAHTELPVIGVPLRSSMSRARRPRRAALDRADAARRARRDGRRRQREERRRARGADPRRSAEAPTGPPGPGSRLVAVIARYSRPEMSRIWSEEGKLARWLEVELAALDGWAEVGASRPPTSPRSAPARRRRRPSASPRSS